MNDVFNPEFKPVFSSTFPAEDYSMLIFNRWGEVIFSSAHPDEGWDGRRADNKNLVEGGAYVWKITFSNPFSKEYKALRAWCSWCANGNEGNAYFCRMKVLMVCLGNICRSPMAEGILRHKAHRNGAGTGSGFGRYR